MNHCLSTCYRYRGRQLNSNRLQVDMLESRKSGLRFNLYLLIRFIPALLNFYPLYWVWTPRGPLFGVVGGGLLPLLQRFMVTVMLMLNSRPCRKGPKTQGHQVFNGALYPSSLLLNLLNLSFPCVNLFAGSSFFQTLGDIMTPSWIHQPTSPLSR